MAYEARALTNRLLDLADMQGLSLTHMALHKVAYFAHGWRLAERAEPLVSELFEAWEHGPVLSSVYGAFKGSGRAPVTTRAERFDPVTQIKAVAAAEFLAEDVKFLGDIVRAYGRLDALALSDMTHKAGGPWDRVWNARGKKITLGMRISNETIRADFLGQLVEDASNSSNMAS
ncbi:Panacea domain-containing protein [Roseococcus pinisoli]|uniref:SocA family protein n=1 Tax=Roseococcus pinisoli TaxID=2835040 RepID=A0ABS5QBC4_9PROT|nr:type II toxin-antitoxin system antitoxin SocA domain-containing protein [Roseococcus pinisoli]MBS7810260.1 SocA family protein [Roseococcus pinisoli]